MRIRLYPLHRFADSRWVRGVAWSILGGSGPLDSGSNPDGPILMESWGRISAVTLSRGTKISRSFEIARDPWFLSSRWGREGRDPLEGNRKVGDPVLQLVLEFIEGLLHRPTADHAPGPYR